MENPNPGRRGINNEGRLTAVKHGLRRLLSEKKYKETTQTNWVAPAYHEPMKAVERPPTSPSVLTPRSTIEVENKVERFEDAATLYQLKRTAQEMPVVLDSDSEAPTE